MPTRYTGRVVLILVVLFAALWAIFPNPLQLFNPHVPFSQKNALRPGIDMVGGTSLLYEIKASEGSTADAHLAERVMEALKKRVDPQGVRNLIWRPQGATRLEIQMPLSGRTGDSKQKREAFYAAEGQLDATNVRLNQVTSAVETLQGPQREQALNELAMGSGKRAQIFAQMVRTWDQIQQAKQRKDAATQADLEDQYEKLKEQVSTTNLAVQDLEAAIDLPAEKREKAIADIKSRYADFAARETAIDKFDKAYAEYQQVKNELDDAGDLKRLLKGSGVLEFHILVEDPTTPDAQAMRERLAKYGPRVQAADTTKWVLTERPQEFGPLAVPYNDKYYVLVYATPDKQLVNGQGFSHWALESATAGHDQYGRNEVRFSFDPQGAQYFSELTRINKGKRLGIVLDDRLISAPNIQSQIGRNGVITGGENGFAPAELEYLVSTLSAGSLPAQLADEPISERTVGPQLGADNLRAGLRACLVGLLVVAVFMICYYYLSGVVAVVALLMNLVLILGVMAMLGATFTLPGVAGIALTIGASVDANVLIFERLREELQRGLSLRMALRNAYDRAFSAIVDSNMTTVITSVILLFMGSEEVRGFGITLLIGIISSVFTALFVTKTIFGLLIDHFGVTKLSSIPLSYPKWNKFLHPSIDWMSKVKYFLLVSAVFLILGCGAFIHYFNQHEMLDIEFASGTSVQFELTQPMKIEDVRSMVSAKELADALPSPTVQSVGTEQRAYEVITPNADSAKVREAVLKKFAGKLNIEQPSTYQGRDLPLEQAMNQEVIPITPQTTAVAGITPRSLPSYRGGVAIVLKDLDPPLSPQEIKTRIGRQRLQVQAGGSSTEQARYHDFTVEAETGPNTPTRTAIVLANDPDLPFDKDEGKWREEVAGPMWKLLRESIGKEATLRQVNTFDASVAGDTQRDALMALALSLIIILAYIWLRFGNFKYGTATVLAMLHDTLLAVGAIGIAHLLSHYTPWLANALLLEPFRLNLTMVAAILTIMSYSMIDTIVVFDRIRENRGKYGHLDRQLVNDSINQTLSRTLLTAGTTIATVAVMYIMGGPGIHGFTFVLLFGILVGTYSSIAIAAPFLLLTRQPQEAVGKRPVGQLQRA